MYIEQKLQELNIELPQTSSPAAAYVMVNQTGNLLFVSGHIAKKNGAVHVGQLGHNISTAEGQEAAKLIAIDLIASLKNYLGDLDKIVKIVKVMSLVNSIPSFTEQHIVTNGCSELLLQVFGEKGKHARSAFGVSQIPLGACVEIEMIVEVI
jgi:enamine deaminase RidA (YjgF/YER057c/UK114 family)